MCVFSRRHCRGGLRSGQRLPSTRGVVRENRLGRNTNAIAFDRLLAEGYNRDTSRHPYLGCGGSGGFTYGDVAAPNADPEATFVAEVVLPEAPGRARLVGALPPPARAGANKVCIEDPGYIGLKGAIAASGVVLAPSRLIPVLRRLRKHVDRHPPIDSQVVLARFTDEGHFGGHVWRMRLLYRERRDI